MRRRRRRAVAAGVVVLMGLLVLIGRALRSPGPAFAPSRGKVRRVVDGDTFHLTNGARVRLLDIDAPEFDGESPELARKSTEALRRLIAGQRVRMEAGAPARDKYGRFLCYVFVPQKTGSAQGSDGEEDGAPRFKRGPLRSRLTPREELEAAPELFVNAEMVRLGLARARTWGPPGTRFDEVSAAEEEAREASRGMWRAPGGDLERDLQPRPMRSRRDR